MIRTVVWDWNGTLLDDVEGCVATLNLLRAGRGMLPVPLADYRARFGFPVRAFYESIGFDLSAPDDYAALSRDFIAEYRRRAGEMRVAPGAREALARLAARGIQHVVVSAMEAVLLGEMLAEHDLLRAVHGFHGTRDHGAGSKVAVGVEAMRQAARDPASVLVVGDTLHDLELAQAIGCRALLYAGGHQDRGRLEQTGQPVIDCFDQLDDHLGAENLAESHGSAAKAGPGTAPSSHG